MHHVLWFFKLENNFSFHVNTQFVLNNISLQESLVWLIIIGLILVSMDLQVFISHIIFFNIPYIFIYLSNDIIINKFFLFFYYSRQLSNTFIVNVKLSAVPYHFLICLQIYYHQGRIWRGTKVPRTAEFVRREFLWVKTKKCSVFQFFLLNLYQ